MNSSLSLPRTLLALSLVVLAALPVLTVTVSLTPTSSNDPFRAIVVVHRTQRPEPPLCCLKPPPTIDSPDGPEGVLLSFEEWKLKQFHAGSQSVPSKPQLETPDSDAPNKTAFQSVGIPSIDAQLPSDVPYPTNEDTLPPYFLVPIVDRFNYANMDCSARVHMAHKSAKSASSILSDKKDKYMLSPCTSTDAQFVVVELCDDIRIDTVQLANFEFFSGVFKDFSVSVAKTYTGTNEGWTPAGTYRAKNVRGVQSFHPPTSLRDFYRYIRIDFHSHYGHEYYCPVSLLRVYGLTHLEEWKWDMWQSESRTRLRDSVAQRYSIAEHPATSNTAGVVSNSDMNVSMTQAAASEIHSNVISSPSPASTPTRGTPSSLSSSSTHAQSPRSATDPGDGTSISNSRDGMQQTITTQSAGIHSVTEAISSLLSISSPASGVSPTPPMVEHPVLYSHDSEIHISSTLSSQPNIPATPSQVQQTTHAPSQQWSGESIYRTIMKRLATLEANHTLYARYVEEQTAGVREVLRKLNEEVGRLESVSRMQAQMYQRTVHEWERQRLRLELEHGELLSRVNYLSDEVVLEKRLSIAQLCLLLAVLVFIGLTRGAPSTQHPPPAVPRSAHEWGIRNLSFGSSTDGRNPLWRSRSQTEQSGSMKAEKASVTPNRLLFSGSTGSPEPKHEFHATNHNHQHVTKTFKLPIASMATSLHKRTHTSSTFRTPTKPRPLMLIDPHTHPRAEPIARSQSSSTSSQHHMRSAKGWARSAHLHEIKVLRPRRGSGGGKRTGSYKDRENESSLGDVFNVSFSSSSQAKAKCRPKNDLRRPLTPLGVARTWEEGTDADAWIDTDVDTDDDDVSVISERAVVLNSPERDVFG